MLILTFTAIVIFEDPRDMEAAPNEWVQFNCTVNCSDVRSASWYMAGRSDSIRDNSSVPGLRIRRTSSRCTPSNRRTYFLAIQATEAFDKSAFYCGASETECQAASSCRCADGRCYSRPALLTGRPIGFGMFLLLNFCSKMGSI